MKTFSVNEIKKELKEIEHESMINFCIRLAKYKKENKELLSYLLFEADNEAAYIEDVKSAIDQYFRELPQGNVYFVKKSLRKILRFLNRQVRYSEKTETELELRIHFLSKMKGSKVPLPGGTVLYNLYQQQLTRIMKILAQLNEDIQADYERDIKRLAI
jgi:hypothetical protein